MLLGTPKVRPKIFLAMPVYTEAWPQALRSFWTAGNAELFDVVHASVGRSLLACCFNSLWCAALNMRKEHGITHFAMLHADIAPLPGWLEKLYEELVSHDADLMSAVSPIKNAQGLTSTCIRGEDDDFWADKKRLTMAEVMELPETFKGSDCGVGDDQLLVNTGCWICDFTRPWVEEVWFEVRDTIQRNPDDTFEPRCVPEDWRFSMMLHEFGCKVMATRKVELVHIGPVEFPNYGEWGRTKSEGSPLAMTAG